MAYEELVRARLEQRRNQVRPGVTGGLKTSSIATSTAKKVVKRQIALILLSVFLAALPWILIFFIGMIVIAAMGQLLGLFG